MLILLGCCLWCVPPYLYVMAVTSVSHVRTRTGIKHINDRKCKWCCNIKPDYNDYNGPYHYIELTAAAAEILLMMVYCFWISLIYCARWAVLLLINKFDTASNACIDLLKTLFALAMFF